MRRFSVYERLAAHEPEEPAPLDALESLHTMVGDWHGLTRVMLSKVDRAFDVQEKGELLRRVGSVREELLGDRVAAIEAYKRAVAEDDADELAYEALDRLYALERKPEPLAQVLARRIELALEPDARVELGLRLGALQHERLHQLDQAIASYQRVLDDDAQNMQALTALSQLFERQGQWSELLENLAQQEGIAQDGAERVRLLHRSGEDPRTAPGRGRSGDRSLPRRTRCRLGARAVDRCADPRHARARAPRARGGNPRATAAFARAL